MQWMDSTQVIIKFQMCSSASRQKAIAAKEDGMTTVQKVAQ